MAANYWMIVTSPENIATTRALGYTMQGLKKSCPMSGRAIPPSKRTVKACRPSGSPCSGS
jgi:hypothetical protein